MRADRIVPFKADSEAPSPNHGKRAFGEVAAILLHATADGGSERGSLEWMRNPKSQVSAHLFITRAGETIRLVEDARKAWHAGASEWEGRSNLNEWSLGFEIANREDGKEPFTDAQYRSVADAVRHYLAQGIERSGVLGHYDVAPGRKHDPRTWDWSLMWRMVDLPDYEPRIVTPRVEPDLRRVEPKG